MREVKGHGGCKVSTFFENPWQAVKRRMLIPHGQGPALNVAGRDMRRIRGLIHDAPSVLIRHGSLAAATNPA
jgi:hypothetical protein